MADPIKALADAARELHDLLKINAYGKTAITQGRAIRLRKQLADALAAYDAAQVSQPPSDAEAIQQVYDEGCKRIANLEAKLKKAKRELAQTELPGDWVIVGEGQPPRAVADYTKAVSHLLMRRARPEPAPSDAEICKWRDYAIRVAGLDLSNAYHRHILDWARGLMRRARPEPAPSDAEIEAWRKRVMVNCHLEKAHYTWSEQNRDAWAMDGDTLDKALRLMRRARPDAGLLRAAKAVIAVDLTSWSDHYPDWSRDGQSLMVAQKIVPRHRIATEVETQLRKIDARENAIARAIDDLRAEVARVEK